MSELIQHFGIDWKLLLAQAINFFILLFLLQRFAYKPIMRLLKDRKREIEKGLEYTEQAREELKRTDVRREETLQKARQDALGIVTEAETVGKKKKEEIIQEANKKVEGVVHDAKRMLAEEKAKMGETVYKNAQELVKEGIIKVLGRLPAEEKNKLLIQEALKELKTVK